MDTCSLWALVCYEQTNVYPARTLGLSCANGASFMRSDVCMCANTCLLCVNIYFFTQEGRNLRNVQTMNRNKNTDPHSKDKTLLERERKKNYRHKSSNTWRPQVSQVARSQRRRGRDVCVGGLPGVRGGFAVVAPGVGRRPAWSRWRKPHRDL